VAVPTSYSSEADYAGDSETAKEGNTTATGTIPEDEGEEGYQMKFGSKYEWIDN